MNRRRTLLAALSASISASLGAAALTAPFTSFAQAPAHPSGKPWRVGILPGGLMAPRKFQWDAFMQRMRELGYVEGKNVQFVIRAPEKEGAAYDALAADLVRQGVDLIVGAGAVAIAAAQKATRSIPIVMASGGDAVALGFVTSLRQPGGNITGITNQSEESTGKRLQLLREMVPKVSRIAFITTPGGKPQLDAAVLVGQTTMIFGLRAQIAALALKHRLPSMFGLPSNADAGGLISYGPSDTEYYRQAAVFVDKIFKGRKPADLPVEQPLKWELVINMKTAKALGITVPPVVLLQAERVIE